MFDSEAEIERLVKSNEEMCSKEADTSTDVFNDADDTLQRQGDSDDDLDETIRNNDVTIHGVDMNGTGNSSHLDHGANVNSPGKNRDNIHSANENGIGHKHSDTPRPRRGSRERRDPDRYGESASHCDDVHLALSAEHFVDDDPSTIAEAKCRSDWPQCSKR